LSAARWGMARHHKISKEAGREKRDKEGSNSVVRAGGIKIYEKTP